MKYTEAEIDEARERAREERKTQGLPESVTDDAALAAIARSLNRLLEANDTEEKAT